MSKKNKISILKSDPIEKTNFIIKRLYIKEEEKKTPKLQAYLKFLSESSLKRRISDSFCFSCWNFHKS